MSGNFYSVFKTALAGSMALTASCSLSFAALQAPKEPKSPYKLLYKFQGGADGGNPEGDLVEDKSGNLYGTTASGGAYGGGTIFEVNLKRVETVIYAFKGGQTDGTSPTTNLIFDSQGNLYGTTRAGGGTGCNGAGCGTVFKLAPNGTETVIHSFGTAGDGAEPDGGMIFDGQGNLFGTTLYGGSASNGTVYKISNDGSETVLYSFQGGSDGSNPNENVVMDATGNLYGAAGGGTGNAGVVFRLAPDGTETTLHTFAGQPGDGAIPTGSLIFDSQGNLYGTTKSGGTSDYGTIFKLAANETETMLYSFKNSPDGSYPNPGLIMDASGNLFGTTAQGGCNCAYQGTIFELSPNGTETTLYAFGKSSSLPVFGLIEDSSGHLYGTTVYRGKKNTGAVFRFTQ
ncbi:MAG TPA: choice-of-anchor tandem repeat GloVer-containing protein [Rhizomicrobium sp.]|jgi:uncharacterized repeat protein (TIGR03803 family)